MKRRTFIMGLGSAAAAWPLAARAQQPKRPTIGFLGATTASSWSAWTAIFVQRLRQLGWIEGQTVAIEYRWAEGRVERFAEFAAELVRLKVDVIVTAGVGGLAAKEATSDIPIVLALVGDPVGTGLVASLARPGGNVTGLSYQSTDLAGKRLQLLREVIPGLRRVAVIADAGNPTSGRGPDEVQATARALGLEVTRLEVRRADEIAHAIEPLKGHVDALYVCTAALLFNERIRINALVAARFPTIYVVREYVDAGGLLSY